jgi:hypothetical protein
MNPLKLTRWPSPLIFLFAGTVFFVFALVTVNLFSMAMASLSFLKENGFEAVRHGALLQVLELALWGTLSLSCWLAFKACEAELISRYFKWARQERKAQAKSRE